MAEAMVPGPRTWMAPRSRPGLAAVVLGLHVALAAALGAALAAAGGGRDRQHSDDPAPHSGLVPVRLVAAESEARMAPAPRPVAAVTAAAAPSRPPPLSPVRLSPPESAAAHVEHHDAGPDQASDAPPTAQHGPTAALADRTSASGKAGSPPWPAPSSEAPPPPVAVSVTATAAAPWQPASRADCAPAPHPLALRERGIEGVVHLSVQVGSDGRAREVRLQGSSGFRLFDEAAMQQARSCRYRPALKDGTPVDSWVEYPVRFALAG
jgi:protein TonB